MIGENYMKQIILSLKHWVNNNFALKENIPEVPVTSVNNMTGDVIIDIPEGFSGSWNDLEDKPTEMGDGFSLTWDGNTEGLKTINSVNGFYKISDEILTLDNFKNGCRVYIHHSDEVAENEFEEIILTAEDVVATDFFNFGSIHIHPREYPYFLILTEDLGASGEKGIYFNNIAHTCLGMFIDNKEILIDNIIPNTIARKTDIPEQFTGNWNDLTNKPTEFTGTYTIKGPNNVDELTPTYGSFYKISDEPLTLENFANGYSFKASHESQTTFYSADNLIIGDLFWPGSYGISHPGYTFFSILRDSKSGGDQTLPRGFYFLRTKSLEHELTIYGNEVLKENILPMEYLHNYTQKLIDENRQYGDLETGGDYIYITSDNIRIPKNTDSDGNYIYVGPYTPTQEELTKGTYTFIVGDTSYPVSRLDTSAEFYTLPNGFSLGSVYVITTPDETFPYVGTYILDQHLSNYPQEIYMLRINGYKKFPYTKYIDNKYLKNKNGEIKYTKTRCIYETTALGLVYPAATIPKSELGFSSYDRLNYKIIEVDGVDYLLEPHYRSGSDEHFLIGDIGYIALGYGGTGSGYSFYYYDLFESGEHSFAIYDTEVSYEVIDEKLIPDTIARVSDIPDLSIYEFITTADIDAICGASIYSASEVTF